MTNGESVIGTGEKKSNQSAADALATMPLDEDDHGNATMTITNREAAGIRESTGKGTSTAATTMGPKTRRRWPVDCDREEHGVSWRPPFHVASSECEFPHRHRILSGADWGPHHVDHFSSFARPSFNCNTSM